MFGSIGQSALSPLPSRHRRRILAVISRGEKMCHHPSRIFRNIPAWAPNFSTVLGNSGGFSAKSFRIKRRYNRHRMVLPRAANQLPRSLYPALRKGGICPDQ